MDEEGDRLRPLGALPEGRRSRARRGCGEVTRNGAPGDNLGFVSVPVAETGVGERGGTAAALRLLSYPRCRFYASGRSTGAQTSTSANFFAYFALSLGRPFSAKSVYAAPDSFKSSLIRFRVRS